MALTLENLPGSVEVLHQKFDKLTKLVETLINVEPKPEPDEVRFNGDRELSEYFRCNIQTIYRLKKAKKLPFHKFGKRYYYLRSEVDKALAGKGGRN